MSLQIVMIRIIGGLVKKDIEEELTPSETVAQRYPYQALGPEALIPQA